MVMHRPCAPPPHPASGTPLLSRLTQATRRRTEWPLWRDIASTDLTIGVAVIRVFGFHTFNCNDRGSAFRRCARVGSGAAGALGTPRDRCRFLAAGDAELGEDAGHVHAGRLLADEEPAAIWRLVAPAITSSSTSRSRGVSAARISVASSLASGADGRRRVEAAGAGHAGRLRERARSARAGRGSRARSARSSATRNAPRPRRRAPSARTCASACRSAAVRRVARPLALSPGSGRRAPTRSGSLAPSRRVRSAVHAARTATRSAADAGEGGSAREHVAPACARTRRASRRGAGATGPTRDRAPRQSRSASMRRPRQAEVRERFVVAGVHDLLDAFVDRARGALDVAFGRARGRRARWRARRRRGRRAAAQPGCGRSRGAHARTRAAAPRRRTRPRGGGRPRAITGARASSRIACREFRPSAGRPSRCSNARRSRGREQGVRLGVAARAQPLGGGERGGYRVGEATVAGECVAPLEQ